MTNNRCKQVRREKNNWRCEFVFAVTGGNKMGKNMYSYVENCSSYHWRKVSKRRSSPFNILKDFITALLPFYFVELFWWHTVITLQYHVTSSDGISWHYQIQFFDSSEGTWKEKVSFSPFFASAFSYINKDIFSLPSNAVRVDYGQRKKIDWNVFTVCFKL